MCKWILFVLCQLQELLLFFCLLFCYVFCFFCLLVCLLFLLCLGDMQNMRKICKFLPQTKKWEEKYEPWNIGRIKHTILFECKGLWCARCSATGSFTGRPCLNMKWLKGPSAPGDSYGPNLRLLFFSFFFSFFFFAYFTTFACNFPPLFFVSCHTRDCAYWGEGEIQIPAN